jgi:hypothetical protein
MAEPQTIPLVSDAFFSIDVVLDRNDCRLTFRWNGTEEKFYMDLEQFTEHYSLHGIAVVPGCLLLEPYAVPELGALTILDSEALEREPSLESFGDIFVLMYTPLEG